MSCSAQKRSCARRQSSTVSKPSPSSRANSRSTSPAGHDPDLGRLDDRHGPVVEVEQREPLADLGQRLVGVRSVVGPQSGGGRLVAAQDGIDEFAPQVGARVAELERGQLVHGDRRYACTKELVGPSSCLCRADS